MYRFKGEYKMDTEATNYEVGCIYRRIATRVNTYPLTNNNRAILPKVRSVSNIETFYQEKLRSLSVAKRLKLASLILSDLVQGGGGSAENPDDRV